MIENLEKGPEHIPTREEIMEVLSRYAEGGTVTRELSDDNGVYLLELTTSGPEEGETTEFTYRRKGAYPNNIKSPETAIEACYYKDGIPFTGETFATYDHQANEWTHNPIEEVNKVDRKVRDTLGKDAFEALAEKGREGILEAYKSICEEEAKKKTK